MSTQFHQESITTGSQQFDIVVGSYGDAKGTKDQFEATDPSCLDGTISELGNTKSFADHIASRIENFRQRLGAAWQGDTANDALDILSAVQSDATTISTSAAQCASALSHFQQQWVSARSQAMNLYEGVMGTGFHEDNSGAHSIFRQFCQSMSDGMHEMPGTLSYHTGMGPHEVYGGQSSTGAGGAGGGLPAVGGGGVPAGGGHYGTPGAPGSLDPGTYPTPQGNTGGYGDPGSGFGGPGSGFGGPGTGGPGDPGTFGGGSGGTTWPPAGGSPSYGSGTTTLSGYGGYPGGVGAAGGGTAGGFGGAGGIGGGGLGGVGVGGMPAGGGGPGAAAGLPGAGLTGAGGGVTPIATVAAVAPGEGGAGGTRAGMMPMRGSGGGDDERDRNTWLDEDDDVWGAAEGLPPVLS